MNVTVIEELTAEHLGKRISIEFDGPMTGETLVIGEFAGSVKSSQGTQVFLGAGSDREIWIDNSVLGLTIKVHTDKLGR